MSDATKILQGQEGCRDFAEIQIAQANHLHESLMEQHSALYRWILAARLTVNGGAAVAVISSDAAPVGFLTTALLLFVVGAVLSIVAAEKDQKAIESGLGPNLSMLGFWVRAKATGSLDQVLMEQLLSEVSQASTSRGTGKRIGFLSLVMFGLGVAVLALGRIDWPQVYAAARLSLPK